MPNHLLLTVLLIAAPLAHAQSPAAVEAPCAQIAAGLTYDVVSIHPHRSGDGNFSATWGDDRYSATNFPLVQVIRQAYGLREDQIAGIPGSLASFHYDIEAKVLGSGAAAPVKLSDNQLRCMLIPLLADRFHLRSHLETRTMPLLDLVPGKTGAKLTSAPSDAKEGSINMNFHGDAWELHATAATMANFAAMLAHEREQTVIDKTELPGRYTFSLHWSRESASDTDADAAPSILTALQEQLGLKLQPAKGPVDILVIDHLEQPSPN